VGRGIGHWHDEIRHKSSRPFGSAADDSLPGGREEGDNSRFQRALQINQPIKTFASQK